MNCWRLHIVASPDAQLAGTIVSLGAGTTIVGREPTAQAAGARLLQLNDPTLSRAHVALVIRDGAACIDIADMASRNGTAVDGAVLQHRVAAEHGSVVRAGATVCVLEACREQQNECREQPDECSAPTAAVAGFSSAAQRTRAELRAAAVDRRPVLITGETGTGKERAAAAVHELSGRRGPLVRLNVAAVPETLFEAEFFGHAKGAFSGAGEARLGWVQQASGGTLVLDEIGELAPPMQAKLLRLLEDQQLRPLGAKVDITVDVQFVASTNADLMQRVQSGAFRQDLAARLRAHEVHLPPLRERRPDVLDLADVVAPLPLGRGLWREALTADAVETLTLYHWPDNLRELDRVLRKVSALGRVVQMSDLPLELVQAVTARAQQVAPLPPALPDRQAPAREHLLAVLQQCKGNVEQAARQLGRDRKQVYRWMEAVGIDSVALAMLRETKPR